MIERRTFLQAAGASAAALAVSRALGSNSSTKTVQPPATQGSGEFFYRPADAWTGDFIPFAKGDEFHLFYMKSRRDSDHNHGMAWYHVSTKDFVQFTDHGEAIPAGTLDEQDYNICTGCVIEAQGMYHIFYTGCNRSFRAKGGRTQAVMHAVSRDLVKWEKIPEDTFYAPTDRFDPHDWRDPFVFWNEEAGEYWMLLAARVKTGPKRRQGCTALCVSKDLKTWENRDPLWAPGLYYTHECPDLFRMGDWWYLVFSEFTEQYRTRYRMSKSLAGPWLAPEDDCFDGRAFYAAKTAAVSTNRFIFGWLPTGRDNKDDNGFDWGGNLVVHALKQEKDGTLSVNVPKTVDAAFAKPLPVQFSSQYGQVKIAGNRIDIVAADSFGCAAAGMMPDRCKIEAQVEFEPGTRGCGIMLRTGDDLDSSYYVRLEPQHRRVVFDSWPPGRAILEGTPIIDNGGFLQGLERPMPLGANVPLDLKILVDGTMAVVYLGGKVALCTRMYALTKGRWGLFVNQGSARFRNIRISGYS